MEIEAPKTALLRSINALFGVLARTLLRYSVSAQEAERLLRRAFVEAAARDYGVRGRPTSKSRIAALTGLSRKDVAQLLDPEHAPRDAASPNRAIRVVSAWLREPAYRDGDGGPRSLPISGPEPSFESLVHRYSGDVPHRAMLRELERVGVVECLDDLAHLRERGFVPRGDNLAMLPAIGEDPAALMHTIDHNLRAGDGARRFQRKAAFTALDAAGVVKLAEFAATRGQALLEEIDALLAPHHDEHAPHVERHHAGLALHVFVDPLRPAAGPARRGSPSQPDPRADPDRSPSP